APGLGVPGPTGPGQRSERTLPRPERQLAGAVLSSAPMAGGAAVGIIANPASGKDVRRLVGAASVVDNNEKVNVVRRLFAGLAATGVHRVHYMPEHFDIVGRPLDGLRLEIEARRLEVRFDGPPGD